MKSGLLISGSAHGLLLSIVLVNGVFLLSESPDLSAKNVDIYLITQAEFDAEVSTPPSVSLDQNVNDEETNSHSQGPSVLSCDLTAPPSPRKACPATPFLPCSSTDHPVCNGFDFSESNQRSLYKMP